MFGLVLFLLFGLWLFLFYCKNMDSKNWVYDWLVYWITKLLSADYNVLFLDFMGRIDMDKVLIVFVISFVVISVVSFVTIIKKGDNS